MLTRANLRRWHIWLGWLVGVPLLLWTLSGLVMVLKPIEETRGVELLAPPSAVRLTVPPVLPSEVAGLPLSRVSLEQRAAGPRWVVELAGGPTRLADPLTGRFLGSLSSAEAAAEVQARWRGQAGIAAVSRTPANNPPLDLRRPFEAWQVRMTDGTHIYVDVATGGILATRTRWWRIYDFMWGLHIMDLRGREDTYHPWLLGFAGLGLVAILLSLILLPLSYWRRRA
jgi:uncharacterized iron-regulated membrane protein